LRLLIVDDSPLVRKMYGLVFPNRDHELVAVEDGRQALRALASPDRFDVILLDLRMPDMNGVEFIRSIRASGAMRVPVVLTTAEPDDSPLLREAQQLGVKAVVRKPWKPQQLRDVIQSVLQQPVR
jgi:CheY-like chemotaxis protein